MKTITHNNNHFYKREFTEILVSMQIIKKIIKRQWRMLELVKIFTHIKQDKGMKIK